MTSAPVTAPPPTSPDLAALISLHEWDELIFGGFICLTCTPDDADDPDQNIYYPCPPLRAAGVDNEMATEIIRAHYAEQARRVKEAHAAGFAVLPELEGFTTTYGVASSFVGDDGDLIALGWHVDPRRVVASMNAHARSLGLANINDGVVFTYGPDDHVRDLVTRAWAVNKTGSLTDWYLTWGDDITCDTPGAFPITHWVG